LIEAWPEENPPAYNTVSTIVRLLQKKGFVEHKAYGRSHQYFPAISKSQYQKRHLHNVLNNVFAGSTKGLVSALLSEKAVSQEDLADLKKLIEESEDA